MLWKTAGQLTELREQLWQEPGVGVGEDASWGEWERDGPSRKQEHCYNTTDIHSFPW